MHVADAGDPSAPAVVALHGWPQHWWLWRGVIGPLAERFRVLAVDHRGFGWSSPAPDGDYRKDRLVDDLLALLDVDGIEQANLIGHDWGGWTGFLAARRAPERVSRLLACNIVPPWTAPQRLLPHFWRFGYQFVIGAPGLGPALHRDPRLLRMAFAGALSPEDVRIFADRLTRPEQAAAGSALYRQFLLREVAPLTSGGGGKRPRMPIAFVFGAKDPVLRPSMLEGLPYEVELVPDAGHFVVDERPELVAERALAFFSD